MSSTGNVYDADATRPALETDACSPTAAYGASKVAAEQLLQDSDLTSAVLRLPFVYGEGDGHLASIPALAPRFGLHPAHTYSVAHHRDIAAAVRLALTGVMDGRIVNLTDDAPVTVFEMAHLAGQPIEGSAEPLTNPWSGAWTARSSDSSASYRACQPSKPQPGTASSRCTRPRTPTSLRAPRGPAPPHSPGARRQPSRRGSAFDKRCGSDPAVRSCATVAMSSVDPGDALRPGGRAPGGGCP